MLELAARPRLKLGKKVRGVRKAGAIPAILYGYKVSPQPLEVDLGAFEKILKGAGESTLVSLKVEGGSTEQVLIYDVSRDVLKNTPLHIDFYAVRLDKPIEASVPIKFIGEAEAVRALGGILVKVLHELEIEALPRDLPHEIEIDISTLRTLDDKISVADIVLPKGVTARVEAETAIALIEAPRSEEELAAMEQPADVSLENIEIAGKKEKEEKNGEAVEEEKKSDVD